MHSLILFASGRGSNVQAIIDYFRPRQDVQVALILTNKADAGVIDIAKAEGIPFEIITRKRLLDLDYLDYLDSFQPSMLVLAGFLLKIPAELIERFRGKIINIHPALLPNYGGKGMWGHNVHNAVLAAGERLSGISIHYVDEEYDRGDTILQARCPVHEGDDADTLAGRIHRLEHFYFPRCIAFLLQE